MRLLRLIWTAALYEMRKATVFRTGFLVRELLRGVSRPLVMVFLFFALLRSSGKEAIGGYAFPDLLKYLILVATFHKVIFHERALDLSDRIFEGYITKYLVMPFPYFTMALGRFLQYTLLQICAAFLFWGAGALLFPASWPIPASLGSALQAIVLLCLGSYCFLLATFIIHCLAFWLNVVWTLLVASRFVSDFINGSIIPVALMPGSVKAVLRWIFPYWTLFAPIEIFLGRPVPGGFLLGLLVLSMSALLLEILRSFVFRLGLRQYTGSGM